MENILNKMIENQTIKSIVSLKIFNKYLAFIATTFIVFTLAISYFTVNNLDKRAAEVMNLGITYSKYLSKTAKYEYNLQLGLFSLNNDKDQTVVESATQDLTDNLPSSDSTQNGNLIKETKTVIKHIFECQKNLYKIIKLDIGNDSVGSYNRLRGFAHKLDPDSLFKKGQFLNYFKLNSNDSIGIDSFFTLMLSDVKNKKSKYINADKQKLIELVKALIWTYNYGELRRNEKDVYMRMRRIGTNGGSKDDNTAKILKQRISKLKNFISSEYSKDINRENMFNYFNLYNETVNPAFEKRNKTKESLDSLRILLEKNINEINNNVSNEIKSNFIDKNLLKNLHLISIVLLVYLFLCFLKYSISKKEKDEKIQLIAKKIINFQDYPVLMGKVWRDIKDVLKAGEDTQLILYQHIPEKKELKIFYDDKNHPSDLLVKKESRSLNKDLESNAVDIFNDNIRNYDEPYFIRKPKRDKPNKKSEVYRYLRSSTNAPLGLLSLQRSKDQRFNSVQLNTLIRISKFFEMAIETDNLLDGTKRIIKIINKSQPIEELINKIHFELLKIINYPITFGIGIISSEIGSEKNDIRIIAQHSQDETIKPPTIDKSSDNKNYPSIECVKNNKEIFINDLESLKRNYEIPKDSNLDKMESFIYLPISEKNETFGCIILQSPVINAFNQKHFDLAGIISIALTKSLLGVEIDKEQLSKHVNNKLNDFDKKELYELIKEGSIGEALEFLSNRIPDSNDIMQLYSRYSDYEKRHQLNLIDNDYYDLRKSKITHALLWIFNNKTKD